MRATFAALMVTTDGERIDIAPPFLSTGLDGAFQVFWRKERALVRACLTRFL